MRTKSLIFLILLFLSACGGSLKYRYYTRINPDGSVYKKVVAVGDSSQIYEQPFSFDTANGWDVSFDTEIDKENGDTLHLAIAEKTFPSAMDQYDNLHLVSDSVELDNIVVGYKKSFRWFFTFHVYKETFLQRFQFQHLDVNEYLSDDELAYFFEGDTTVVASMTKEEEEMFDEEGEARFWNFIMTSCALEYLDLLDQYAKERKIEPLSPEDSASVVQLFRSFDDDGVDINEIGSVLQNLINISWPIIAYDEGYFDEFEQQINDELLLLDEKEYDVSIDLPGVLYSTNADAVADNIAKWQFRRGRFLYKDFTIWVKYRTTNYWTIILTALSILLFTFISLFNEIKVNRMMFLPGLCFIKYSIGL